jgi:hypothetical protein
MTWLATLPAGPDRDAGVQETYRVWLSRDREAAMAWMRGAELEPWLEPALALFAVVLARESPAEALEWAERILDDERRLEATAKIGRQWLRADPEAARSWLDEAELPDQTRAWILAPPKERRGRRGGPRQGGEPLQGVD